MPMTTNFCCDSQIALSPVPHPITRALQGAIGVVVTALWSWDILTTIHGSVFQQN